jgi:transcriptional regulator GlxA family with amidase domain
MTIVDVVVLQGASPASVAITFELLAAANRLRHNARRPPCFVVRISGSGAEWARSFAGPAVTQTKARADVVIIPGLAWSDERLIRDGLRRPDADIARGALRAASRAGAEIASSCSAVFLVASAGLLNKRRATTTWWLAPLFRQLFPEVLLEADGMVVTDGKLTTAGAAMAQLDLMLSVIARHADADLADHCARLLLLDERRSQSRYMAISYLTAADERVGRAERWARRRLHKALSIAELAEAAGLGLRTFARRCERATGLSPIRLLQRLRVEKAVELLETTHLGLDDVAQRVGYAEPSTLRKLLRRDAALGARTMRAGRSGAKQAAPRRGSRRTTVS